MHGILHRGQFQDAVISFLVGEAGCEGFTWCAVTKGSEEVVRSSDE